MKKLLRPVFTKIASLLGIPNIYDRLNTLEDRVSPSGLGPDMFSILERRFTDLMMSQVENRLTSHNENLVSYVDAKQQQSFDSIDELALRRSDIISNLRQSLDATRRLVNATSQIAEKTLNSEQQFEKIDDQVIIDDALYVALENHFRGSRDLVAQRQREYLPMLPDLINPSTPLIDLGCGRGEWLKVLRDQGIPAIGVDTNAVCIAECRDENLDVRQDDLLDFLAARPDASVGAYTLFQVFEHLPFPALINTLREIRRTLVPGGRLIAEVPNAKNLRVSAGTFWIDPTHQRPLFPELLMFLATEVGFKESGGHYTNNLSPHHDLSGLPEGAMHALKSVLDAVDGPGDFALIATA